MKYPTLIFLFFLLLASLIVSGFTIKPTMEQYKFQLNTKDFPEDGIVIIAPSNPAFRTEVSSLLRNRQVELFSLVEAVEPYCFLVRNNSSQEVVGCSITWEIVDTSGRVVSIPQSYSTPGVLEGLKPIDPAMVGHTSLINRNGALLITLDDELQRFIQGEIRSADRSDDENPVRNDLERHLNDLRATYEKQLQSVSTITVCIDGLFFKDGTFIGPDRTQSFTNMKALIDARREFGQSLDREIRARKAFAEIFERIEALSKEPVVRPDANAAPDEYYLRTYQRAMQIFAMEFIRIKSRRGWDEAVDFVLEPLKGKWPTLRRK